MKMSILSFTMNLRVNKKSKMVALNFLSEFTNEFQEWFPKNSDNPYAELNGDYHKYFNTYV